MQRDSSHKIKNYNREIYVKTVKPIVEEKRVAVVFLIQTPSNSVFHYLYDSIIMRLTFQLRIPGKPTLKPVATQFTITITQFTVKKKIRRTTTLVAVSNLAFFNFSIIQTK